MTVKQRVSPFTSRYLSLFSKAIFVLFAISIISCSTEPDFLGENLIPNQDKIGLELDTSFVISAYTIASDTILTRGISKAHLGYIHDEIFGKTKADFLMQMKLPSLNFSFGDSPVADSLILTFKLSRTYGDKTNPLVVKVHELIDSLSYDSLYNVLGSLEGKFKPEILGQTTYYGDSLLKIKLDNELAQRLISLDSVTLSKQTNFVDYFKGLYITVDDLGLNQRSMYSFDLTSNTDFLKLYYHNSEPEDNDSLIFAYYSDVYTPRYNHFQHDYTLASPEKGIKFLNDTITQDSVFYLQGFGGVYGKLRLDGLTNWIDSMPVVINRAELIIERENSLLLPEDSILNSIAIYMPIGEGQLSRIVDASSFSSTFGGTFSQSKNYYSFNITLHLQQLLTGDLTEKWLILEPSNTLSEVNRAILRSGNHRRKIRLALTYTKL